MAIWDSIRGAFSGGGPSRAYENASNQFFNQAGRYNPWIKRGNMAGDMLYDEYASIMDNPNFRQDQIAAGFQMSPYQQKLLSEVTNRANMNAANSGMSLSPAALKALSENINAQTGQFQNDYVNRGLQTYGMGLQGLQGQQGIGLQALGDSSNLVSQGIGANLNSQLMPYQAGNNLLGFGTGLGMAYLTGGKSAFPGLFGSRSSSAPMSMGAFRGGGSLMPNTGSWTGQNTNPYSSTYYLR